MRNFGKNLDLQSKIFLVLILVIVPTFIGLTLLQTQITKPYLDEEMKQVGIQAGKQLASELTGIWRTGVPKAKDWTRGIQHLEETITELMSSHPHLARIDVGTIEEKNDKLDNKPLDEKSLLEASRAEKTSRLLDYKWIASSGDSDPESDFYPLKSVLPSNQLGSEILGKGIQNEFKKSFWEIWIPVEAKALSNKKIKKHIGIIHVVISMNSVQEVLKPLWKVTASAAALSMILLLIFLSYFLRKTIFNDKLLREFQSQNIHLLQELHEAHREITQNEKFATIGQVAATFAHELGTPLNAMGLHLEILEAELKTSDPVKLEQRFILIQDQLKKITTTIQGLLQMTRPVQSAQLVDLHRILTHCVGVLGPRIDSLKVRVSLNLSKDLLPMRLVPYEFEQMVLNFLNNALDSLKEKLESDHQSFPEIRISSQIRRRKTKFQVVLKFWDSGNGIISENLKNVKRPFFTTKPPGKGTGLGLSICEQTIKNWGGNFEITSESKKWTQIEVTFPYAPEITSFPSKNELCSTEIFK